MRLSARARYASRILLDLAFHKDQGPIPTATLSRHTGISVKFIEQILKPLRKEGFISSVRGAAGGYQLKRAPEKITLGQIVRLMEGGISLTVCCDDADTCTRSAECRTRGAWLNISRVLERELDKITLAELMEEPGTTEHKNCLEDRE